MCGAADPTAHRQMIRAANTHGAAIHVFAIDTSVSGGSRPFLQGVASDARSLYFDLP